MRQPAKLPKPLLSRFQDFLETHPPQQFSSRLRYMLLEYLKSNVHTGFPLQFDQFLWSLSDLFELLDEAAAHQSPAKEKNERP